jgi:hypothetical protein
MDKQSSAPIYKRLGWFALLYVLGVLAVVIVAGILRVLVFRAMR